MHSFIHSVTPRTLVELIILDISIILYQYHVSKLRSDMDEEMGRSTMLSLAANT